jgi:Tfp pilus assembly protein PilN
MKEINLLKTRRKFSFEQLKLIRGAKVASVLLLLIYCLGAVAVFSYWFNLNKKGQRLEEEIENYEQRIKKQEKTEYLQSLLKQKLVLLSSLTSQREYDYRQVLDRFEAAVPEGVAVEKMLLDQEGRLSLEGMATNAVVLADFFDQLLSSENDDFIKEVKVSSLGRGQEGDYVFSLFLNVEG